MTVLHRDQVIPGSNGVRHGERPSLVREYLKTEPRKLALLAGFLVGVVVLVTVPYVLVVGWNKWTSDMREAGHRMWASNTPAADVGVAPAPAPQPVAMAPGGYGYGYGYAVVPVAAPPQGRTAVVAPRGGRQYVCPSCGAVGLPAWTRDGRPRCPICGGQMQVAPLRQPAFDLAAAP